jgi:hypothetical protein
VLALLKHEELQKPCVEPMKRNVAPTSSLFFWDLDEKMRKREEEKKKIGLIIRSVESE